MNIEARHLRHVLVLAELGNFSRAAEALHITQPALSRSIQAVEACVGAPVFGRQRGGVEPTEVGLLLLQHARTMDILTRDLEREIRLTKGLDLGDLRIGVGPFGASALIGPVVGKLNRLHPRLHVSILVTPWQELPQRIQSRDVDLILIELSEVEQMDEFESLTLSPQPAFVVCRTGHPLTALPSPQPKDVFMYPLAGPKLPFHAAQTLAKAAQANPGSGSMQPPPRMIECDSSTILKSILLESDAVTMMPQFMVEAELKSQRLCLLTNIEMQVSTRFGAAWLKHRSLSRASQKFLELLQAQDAVLSTKTASPRHQQKKKPGKPNTTLSSGEQD